jgi:hypothetical protein
MLGKHRFPRPSTLNEILYMLLGWLWHVLSAAVTGCHQVNRLLMQLYQFVCTHNLHNMVLEAPEYAATIIDKHRRS